MCGLSWSTHGHLRSKCYHGQLQNLSSFITKNYRKVEDLPKAKVFQNLNGEIRNQTTKEPERYYHTRKMFTPCIANQSKEQQRPSKERKKTMFRTRLKTTEENPSQTEEQILVRIIESFARLKIRSHLFNPLKMCNFNWAKLGHSCSQFYHAQSRNQSPITTRNNKKLEDLPRAWVLSKNQRTKSEIQSEKNKLLLPASQKSQMDTTALKVSGTYRPSNQAEKNETFKKSLDQNNRSFREFQKN